MAMSNVLEVAIGFEIKLRQTIGIYEKNIPDVEGQVTMIDRRTLQVKDKRDGSLITLDISPDSKSFQQIKDGEIRINLLRDLDWEW